MSLDSEFDQYFKQLLDFVCDNYLMDFQATLSAETTLATDDQVKRQQDQLAIVTEWLRRMFEYNLTGGKMYRGKMVVRTFRLINNDQQDHERLQYAQLLGWCMEMFQASFLLVDDVMDRSETRRGRTCWYRLPDVGMLACNDSMMLESSIFHLLRHSGLQDHACYLDLIHLFHEGFRVTSIGQCLDVLTEKSRDFNQFTMDRYRAIIRNKTAFYTFSLPIRLALYLAEIDDLSLHRRIEPILMTIGELYQVQDDYLDCFGDYDQMGKIGTDIRDGKCTWLIVKALEITGKSSSEDRQLLEEHYGKQDPESENIIKQLFKRLKLDDEYREYHRQKFSEINEMIEQFMIGEEESNKQHLQQWPPSKLISRELFREPLLYVSECRNK